MMLTIRYTEEIIAERYKNQEMKTPVHLGIGQEAPAVAVCTNLISGDAVFSHHRAHNHFLASGGSIFSLVAELHGRVGGCSRGRGGSVHLTHTNKIFFASNAILGESTALAAGSALSFKLQKQKNIGVSFFGDATWEEGVLYETLNFAAIHALPILFVCENNLYATESPLSVRKPSRSNFIDRAKSFGIEAHRLDGNDLVELQQKISEIISEIRVNPAPIVIECETYRWKEHVGVRFDHELGREYRDLNELNEWQKKDPISRMQGYLLLNNILTLRDVQSLKHEVQLEVEHEFELARLSPFPDPDSLFLNSGEI